MLISILFLVTFHVYTLYLFMYDFFLSIISVANACRTILHCTFYLLSILHI